MIIITCLSGIIFAIPSIVGKDYQDNLPQWFPKRTINLGLDLRGGSHLLLEVDFKNYLKEQIELLKELIRKEIRSEKLAYQKLEVSNNSIIFIIKDASEIEKAKKILQKYKHDMKVDISGSAVRLYYSDEHLSNLKDKVLEQSIEIIRRRVDETGTKEPSIQKQGTDYILLQVPGLQDPKHLKNLLGQTAKLTFHLLNTEASVTNGQIPLGSMLVNGEIDKSGKQTKYLVEKKAVLSGDLLVDAKANINDRSAVVEFSFNTLGAKRFAEITTQNVGKPLAIILDNKVISAPQINEPIVGGSGIIKGNFSAKTANDLALLLRAGALPAPLKVVEERTVGPSLGSDSIEAGKKASIIGIIAVMVFMLLTYAIFGMFANIALVFNMLFIITILSFIGATLTMPGIAGIILTMGMAVDANVLIFERIREEARLGLSLKATIERGFKNAFSTILDSNLTTIFAALLLYLFGSGAVKGFAVTLIIGILASMFSAIILTKLMIYCWLKLCKPKRISI